MLYTHYLVDDIFNLDSFLNNFRSGSYYRRNFPYINLYEKEDTVVIKTVIPGVKAEDIKLELVNTSLVIEGERKSDLEDKPYIRKEREFGKFKKSIKLPYQVDREKINADLKDGILTITLEKSEDAKPKKIEIK